MLLAAPAEMDMEAAGSRAASAALLPEGCRAGSDPWCAWGAKPAARSSTTVTTARLKQAVGAVTRGVPEARAASSGKRSKETLGGPVGLGRGASGGPTTAAAAATAAAASAASRACCCCCRCREVLPRAWAMAAMPAPAGALEKRSASCASTSPSFISPSSCVKENSPMPACCCGCAVAAAAGGMPLDPYMTGAARLGRAASSHGRPLTSMGIEPMSVIRSVGKEGKEPNISMAPAPSASPAGGP
mmetsp:Transcript_16937/g.42427  ORF Transcript_16937/g.42427 Transcript_16937/m.42427 type:complete len:245 (+) Transcript_16937:558-1292(+)